MAIELKMPPLGTAAIRIQSDCQILRRALGSLDILSLIGLSALSNAVAHTLPEVKKNAPPLTRR